MNMTDEVRHCSDGGCPLLNAVARSAREQPPYARRRENHAPRASGSRPLLNEDFPLRSRARRIGAAATGGAAKFEADWRDERQREQDCKDYRL